MLILGRAHKNRRLTIAMRSDGVWMPLQILCIDSNQAPDVRTFVRSLRVITRFSFILIRTIDSLGNCLIGNMIRLIRIICVHDCVCVWSYNGSTSAHWLADIFG